MKKARQLSNQEAKARLEKYCSMQERCHSEVRYKLIALGIRGEALEQIIAHLVEQNYLDETRYATAYARGKLRMNGWGWIKIQMGLKRKGISDYNLRQAYAEINTPEYDLVLRKLLVKKIQSLADDHPLAKRQKLFRFARGRGFEGDKISAVLAQIND